MFFISLKFANTQERKQLSEDRSGMPSIVFSHTTASASAAAAVVHVILIFFFDFFVCFCNKRK